MTYSLNTLVARAISVSMCSTILVACGGGGGDSAVSGNAAATTAATTTAATTTAATTAAATADASMTTTASSIYSGRGAAGQTPGSPTVSPAAPAVPAVPAAQTRLITNVRLENTGTVAQNNVPFSFGQTFAVGHLAKGTALQGRLENGEAVALQIDVKATHADGSVRHAVVSGVVPSLAANAVRTMELLAGGTANNTAAMTPAQLLGKGFTTLFVATIAGVRYEASADTLLKNAKASTWLAGPTANEWEVSAPLTTSSGVAHPHLTARFAIRAYASGQARVDVSIENAWAYEANPQNFTYDAQLMVGGQQVFAQTGLNHYHHARWRKLFWWGGAEPTVNVKHDIAYLLDSRALPNYDRSVQIPETTLANLQKKWNGTNRAPMGVGMSVSYMPQTGGREDLGLLPSWAATYLLSMDKRAKDATLGTADLAGSWSMHYRDKNTGQPISLIDYPYMTILGRSGDTKNKATGKLEAFPYCPASTTCKTPYTHDTSHQPAFAYLPYVVTGDHYYLEELQFWSMYNVFSSNPGYRSNIQGLVKPDQVRGQAWSLRTLAEAAYITPDNDRLKEHFTRVLDSNMDWYNANYTDNPQANKLGVIVDKAIVYNSSLGVGPWQDDFFTSAIGHAAELGFPKAEKLLKWKLQFPVQRMVGEGACFISGAMYSMNVRPTATAPLYNTIGEAFRASVSADVQKLACGSAEMGKQLKLSAGEMTGYSNVVTGYPSNMQPALAYGANYGGANGAKAWSVFMSRSVKPNYANGPQFDVVPR